MKTLFKILFFLGAIIWFLVVCLFGGIILRPISVDANSLEAFRNYFRLELKDFGIILLSLIPLILFTVSLKRFKTLGISLLAALVLLTILSLIGVSSLPPKAKVMMKLPLPSDAYNVKYVYSEGIDVTNIEIGFSSNQSSESVLDFYQNYFLSHGWDQTPKRYLVRDKEAIYTCQGGGIELDLNGKSTTITFSGKFEKDCLNKL